MGGRRRRRPTRRAAAAPRWINRTTAALVALGVIGALALSLFVVQALEIRSLRRDLAELHAAEQAATVEQGALRERLAEADDLDAVEEEARERLGWVRPGEEKVVFVEPEEE